MADLQGFDVRFESGMSKSPMGLILSRFRCNGADFLRVKMFIFSFFKSVQRVSLLMHRVACDALNASKGY